jgi:predicted RecA/RadA family phage recombinase
MSTNYVQEGKTLDLLAPYAVSSGDGLQVGSIFAVALGDAANGAAVRGMTEGVFDIAKTSAQAWTVGQKVYWDNSAKVCDTDGTLGILIGTCTEIAANPTSTGKVRLNGAAPATSEGPQAAIVALTDSTGGSGTHDDTLADGLTVGAALVDNSGGAAADGTIAVLVDAGGTAAGAPTTASVANAISELATRCNDLRTDLVVQNQNDSDIAQKILEIRTALIAAGILAAA